MRPPAKSFRLDTATDERLDWLTHALELTTTDVIRQAVRQLYYRSGGETGEKGRRKKSGKKRPQGIDSGNTTR